jgi:hypothetical protein
MSETASPPVSDARAKAEARRAKILARDNSKKITALGDAVSSPVCISRASNSDLYFICFLVITGDAAGDRGSEGEASGG